MPDENNGTEDYEVGYGKPPKANQFPKGKSGNPSGRPRKQKTAAQLTEELSKRKVNVTDAGKQVRMTTLEVMVKQVGQKAMQGDLRAFREIINMLTLHSESSTPGDDITRQRSARQGMIETFVAMMAKMSKEHPLQAAVIDEEEDECSNLIK